MYVRRSDERLDNAADGLFEQTGIKKGKASGLPLRFSKIINRDYLLENWNLFLAPFCPYFFLSFILGSLVMRPAFLRTPLKEASERQRALAMPCLTAPA